MIGVHDPSEERERTKVLSQHPLDAAGSDQLDRIARLAAISCDAPIGLVSIVESDRQVFAGKSGLDVFATSGADSFCAHCVSGRDPMVVPDATRDPRFAGNPLVTGAPDIRFYAGHPVVSPDGRALGTICIVDRKPRASLSDSQTEALRTLAHVVASLLDGLRADACRRVDQSRSLSMVAELEQRFAVLADSLPQLVWSALPDGMSDYFNRPWCEFTGSPAAVSHGTGWLSFVHPDDVPVAADAWDKAVGSGDDYEVRYRLRRHDGVHRWVIARGHSLRDEQGVVIRWIGTCTDIDDEMATADALELLSQELGHRIKNIFSVIGGLVSLSSRSHPDAGGFARELYDRILALGRAHGYIGSRTDASSHGGLKGLLAELLSPFGGAGEDRIAITGDDIAIDDRSGTPLALVFHELATNSAKYGAIASEHGRIGIHLVAGDPVRMTWIETGIETTGRSAKSGFGSSLIDMSITRQLGGYHSRNWGLDTLRMEITIPSANLSRQ